MSENEQKDDTATPDGTDEGRPISNRLLEREVLPLHELQNMVDAIAFYGSGMMLIAATELARRMKRDDLERLTDRCITEERLDRSNAPLTGAATGD